MEEERLNPNLELFRKLDALELFYKAIRCFFVSCVYLANNKSIEAGSLVNYSENLLTTALDKFNEHKC